LSNENYCECPYCAGRFEFEIDEFLFDELEAQNVVLFIGAGVSTENKTSAPHSLYVEIARVAGLNNSDLPFPDVVEKACAKPDGRFHFMQKVQHRFDYIQKFSDLRNRATRFFKELATMPYFETFITTNWDRYLEDICAAKPYVYDSDMRFWEVTGRKVLKIHGTIDDYSSIIASRTDYEECRNRLPSSLIGGKLKELLTTKTCVFVGYSLQDDDFLDIYEFVKQAHGKFPKTHYFVSPFDEKSEDDLLEKIHTDGTFFLETVKEHMCNKYCFLEDWVYDAAEEELIEVLHEHQDLWDSYDLQENPQVILSGMYQDGLIHALQMARDVRATGKFSDVHALRRRIFAYEDKIKEYRRRKSYSDVAYFRGFQNVLIAFAEALHSDWLPSPPRYFFAHCNEMDRDEFVSQLELLPDLHKAAFRECEKFVSRWPSDQKFVPQHSAWG